MSYLLILLLYVPLAIFVYIFYTNIIYPYYLSPYRSLPRDKNPLKHWILYYYNTLTGKLDNHLELIQRFGNICHIKDNFVLIQDPELRKYYLTYKFKKDPIYSLFDINGPNLFSTIDKDFHTKRKKLISPAFSLKSLANMEPTIYRVGSDSLIRYINSQLHGDQSKEIDLYPLFNSNTMDVITELVFGQSLNTTWDSDKAKYYNEVVKNEEYTLFLKAFIPFCKHIKAPLEVCFKPMILENIRRRKESDEIHYDILQSLIDARDPETNEKLKDLEIVDECVVLLFGGMDNTSNTMIWTIYEILKHPKVYKLVSEEILEKFPNLNEPITVERAKKELKYLEAAILESMRKNPVASGALARVVPEGGITIEGYYLPENTIIGIDSYAQHNDPKLWNKPEVYDIYRWLEKDRESNKSLLLTWGLGPTSCIGRELAWAEIFLVLANLIRNFEFELIDKKLTPYLEFLNKPKEKRLKVNVSRRVQSTI